MPGCGHSQSISPYSGLPIYYPCNHVHPHFYQEKWLCEIFGFNSIYKLSLEEDETWTKKENSI